MPRPLITVYTISLAEAGHCLEVIRDLQKQTIAARIELIVVAESGEGVEDAALAAFHSHQIVLIEGLRTVGVAMAAAVRAARASWVVYAEEHATFEPDWAEQLVAAHDRGYPAVGFSMRNANPETLTSWAHLYGQFGPAVDPVESSEVRLLTGHHASYLREALLGYGDLLVDMLEDESALFLDMHQRGQKLLMSGEAISYHINLSRFSTYLGLDFFGQRSFANGRVAVGKWPVWKRLAYACACPVMPLVRLRRILFHLRRTRRFGELMPRILLPILPALTAGAAGEALGYLFGSGTAAERKLGPELRRRDFLAAADPARAGHGR